MSLDYQIRIGDIQSRLSLKKYGLLLLLAIVVYRASLLKQPFDQTDRYQMARCTPRDVLVLKVCIGRVHLALKVS